jgi:hypothetical protein
MDIPEQKKLEQVTKKLAEILRVQDWDIKTHIVSGHDIAKQTDDDNYTARGVSVRNTRSNTADIYLSTDEPGDWYETLVHELIHVQTTTLIATAEAYFEKHHSYFENIYESMVERQAQIFVKLYPVTNFNDILGK